MPGPGYSITGDTPRVSTPLRPAPVPPAAPGGIGAPAPLRREPARSEVLGRREPARSEVLGRQVPVLRREPARGHQVPVPVPVLGPVPVAVAARRRRAPGG